VKGYSTPVLTGAFTTPKRLAILFGMPTDYSMFDMAVEYTKLIGKGLIPPKEVDSGPVFENILEGDKIDLFNFPAPHFYPLDGGRYFGTAVSLVTKDPDTGWVNLGTYRMQLLGKDVLGAQFVKGKHALMHLNKYKKMKKKMPAAAIVGFDPILFAMSSSQIGFQMSEYDLAGALRKRPIEVVKSDLTGLPIPARAEFVVEGEIDPDDLREEGPFGEYTGYYSGLKAEEWPKPCLQVKRILHRNNPILHATTVGKPVTDTHMLGVGTRTGALWNELLEMRVPGIKSVYYPPEAIRYLAIVSVEQMYPGHAMHVGMAAHSTTTGHYGLKTVIVVDSDIRADDIPRVIWAMSARYNPATGTTLIDHARSTPLDPSLPINARDTGSKVIINTCIPYEWKDKPIDIALDEDVKTMVLKRWKEYGFQS